MTRTEDYREKKDGDDADLEPDGDDKRALDLEGKNPLAEEESIKEDDSGGD
ncbi:MAG TPA: hypothetical protein VG102_03070 [Candidatus Paceibacterota bacterium]|jgi:hypothetical protein|nr:hypothetical protein [Candidatus Paceibacterota bacterium]